MKHKIALILHHEVQCIVAPHIYIADHKNYRDGLDIKITDCEQEIRSVHLYNPHALPVAYDIFPENAFPKYDEKGSCIKGIYQKQCECILFPEIMPADAQAKYWVLLIETKYSSSSKNANRLSNDYPQIMTKQIIETTSYLREKRVLNPTLRVSALVSFPKLTAPYQGFLFQGAIYKDANGQIFTNQDIQMKLGINILAHDCAFIQTNARIKLGRSDATS